MNVLLSAYACQPGRGSEPGVGFETLMGIAKAHDVWVLTRTKNVGLLEDALRKNPLASRVHLEGIELSTRAQRIKRSLGAVGFQWYYDRWQKEAQRRAADLSRAVRFDIAHHVTFSSDWTRAVVATLAVPFVWGPIGGGVNTPSPLITSLGVKGIMEEVLRVLARWAMRRRSWHRQAWDRAGVVLAQNAEATSLARDPAKTRLLPHSTAMFVNPPAVDGPRTKEVVAVGRLVPWKGGHLAIRAMVHVTDPQAMLHFIGKGPDRRRLERIARKLGLQHRVKFDGPLSRGEVMTRVTRAGVLLHSAVHDESPVAVAEALSVGTPVVCLDHGGPPELLRRWAHSPGAAVRAGRTTQTARRLGNAVSAFLAHPPPISEEARLPDPPFLEAVLEAYDLASGAAAASTA